MHKRILAVVLAVAALTAFSMGQGKPKKTVEGTQVRLAIKPVPNSQDFKTYEDFAAALVDWALEREANANGKQPILSAAPVVGRYQIVANPNVRADTFLLDTQTGRVWTPTKYTNLEDQPTVWQLQDRVDSDLEFFDWAKRHTAAPKNGK